MIDKTGLHFLSTVIPLIMFLSWFFVGLDSRRSCLLWLVCLVGFFFNEGYHAEKTNTSTEITQQNKLVSVSSPSSQVEGSFSGFLIYSGYVGESRVYYLREEIREGLYKDLTVKKEVYLREDDSLVDTGKFLQYSKCYYLEESYTIAWWKVYEPVVKRMCKFSHQEIVVPKGVVIKDMTGI